MLVVVANTSSRGRTTMREEEGEEEGFVSALVQGRMMLLDRALA